MCKKEKRFHEELRMSILLLPLKGLEPRRDSAALRKGVVGVERVF